ncbi:MAG: hypothetical protein IPK52_04740 [Chloroflexi bacterium]|nr:hypothetical protein [Chloroflexota bacterium]
MNNAFVVTLGSGAAAKRGVGNKGRLLDMAVRAGLPVPRGVIVLDTVADLAVLHGAVEQDAESLRVIDAAKLSALLQLPAFTRPVAVRSAFSAEDSETASLAGYFRSVLHVDAADSRRLGAAIETVWASAHLPREVDAADSQGDSQAVRRDLLVMEMVSAERSGVAFTEREFEDDLVNFVSGTSERLLGGQISGEALSLPKLRGWEKMPLPRDLPSWTARLQRLLRDIRRWLGAQDWDVEWADDGKICWLVQLRPVTRPTRRDETFSIANHKEILPHLPSPFMTSVVESCAFDLYSYYRDFDPSLPKDRPFLEVFHGRPYINLSLMAETMRHWGLPTRLVTDNIGGSADSPYGLNLRRLINKSLRLTLPRQALAQVLSIRRARQATLSMDQRLTSLGTSLPDLIEAARWLYVTLVRQMFSLLAASGPLVSVLAHAGVLAELDAHHVTISTQKFRDQETIREYVAAHPAIHIALRSGKVPEDDGFLALWSAYLAQFGHRGVFESDLSRPRDVECPESILQSLANLPILPANKTRRSLKARLLWPLWLHASRSIRAREQWRHDAMRGFAAVRAGLLEAIVPYIKSGALPDAEHFWLLRIDEARSLSEGWHPDNHFWQARREEVHMLAALNPPDLLRRFHPHPASPDGDLNGVLRGIPLTRGERSGRALVLHEPISRLPEGFRRDTTVLVARSVDVGWVSTFGLVSGVVVETGGHLSHGSIILREIGLPAVTNVTGVTQAVTTGEMIALNAEQGLVTRLNQGE